MANNIRIPRTCEDGKRQTRILFLEFPEHRRAHDHISDTVVAENEESLHGLQVYFFIPYGIPKTQSKQWIDKIMTEKNFDFF
jgi:hypothetical protein